MRIAMVRSKSPAGIEPRLEREATALVKVGHQVDVLLWDRKLEYQEKEERAGFVIHRCRVPAPEGHLGLLPQMLRWWNWEMRTLSCIEPDAVHSCDLDTAIPAMIFCRLRDKRFVYDIFDFYAYMIAQPLGGRIREMLARLERFVARKADLIILADKARVGQLGKAFARPVAEIMNVPERVELMERDEPEFTVFCGGMISEERGLRQLVEATGLAGVRLVVAGHGSDEATLVPLFEKSPHVAYLGNIPYSEVLRWTARSHVIAALYDPAIPNNRLASPNKLFEAMMLSKPVLTNEEIRPAEIVREVHCGVVAHYDDVKEIAAALLRLSSDSEERRTLGERGRRAFEEKYNWPVMEKRLITAYESL